MSSNKCLKEFTSFLMLVYLAHLVNSGLPFLYNFLIRFSNVKLTLTTTLRSFLLQPPSMEELLVLKDFKLKDERNKGFVMGLLKQN